ncbi:hypothetical protein [Caproiciproducens faecalis]|uniref:Uncharacterized protein n=1 Tax=Caproiciproducens faecalis TaxID=2820301 RepID=A0ABS7DRH4_9FIRM|nr:hypothetical protein [Caproiciproducens faecalis]MBW7573888.1 hypothetical protein [Caproiciproducens faecalis]
MSKDKLERIIGDASIKRYFNTEYIGAYSLDDGAEPVLTIDSLWYGDITLGGGRKEPHVVVKFKERSVPGVEEVKPLILNATNRKALKKMYGSDSAASLEGRKIQLYVDPHVRDPQDGGFTEGLRIRPSIPKQTVTATKCADCGAEIQGAGKLNAQQIAQYTYQKYGKSLCSDCATKIKAEDDARKAALDPLAAAPESSAPDRKDDVL